MYRYSYTWRTGFPWPMENSMIAYDNTVISPRGQGVTAHNRPGQGPTDVRVPYAAHGFARGKGMKTWLRISFTGGQELHTLVT